MARSALLRNCLAEQSARRTARSVPLWQPLRWATTRDLGGRANARDLAHAAAGGHGERAPALTTCVDCGGAPCLASACAPRSLGGVCQRDAMVAAAVRAGFADVDVPLHCERRRDYLCESEPARRRFRCALVTAPAPRWNSSVALAAPQLYPPSYMTGRHTPQYYSTASEEAAKGIMYDKRVVASRVNGVPFYEWRDGGQKKYFLPQLEYTLNEGTGTAPVLRSTITATTGRAGDSRRRSGPFCSRCCLSTARRRLCSRCFCLWRSSRWAARSCPARSPRRTRTRCPTRTGRRRRS